VSTPPENLAGEVALLTRRVAELEAELEASNILLGTYKAMLFGSRSEKARTVLDEQGCLNLGDLSDMPIPLVAANDDPSPTTSRPRAKRNIGALPKHLPRVIELIEPARTRCARM
jgi:hypothetical protein